MRMFSSSPLFMALISAIYLSELLCTSCLPSISFVCGSETEFHDSVSGAWFCAPLTHSLVKS